MLVVPYAVLLACWAAGSVGMAVCVLRGPTAFPRWMCAATPLVLVPVGALITKALPGAAGTALRGAALSVGNLLFFSLTTAALWRRR
ncbi:DUF6796 family protein [Streptomyces caatingaensis]|uniref:Uncharacterized protein n=1 Tax=Streptomyces caatingaensis TaxID=1678637 RepID=A0A0K9XBM0_9ACTN|nr:DUF6796 family protein [Streptomyces caatingaensis]KNB50799.1 hypothetical protein AC230_20375 [Streptomyces caatingaensis]